MKTDYVRLASGGKSLTRPIVTTRECPGGCYQIQVVGVQVEMSPACVHGLIIDADVRGQSGQ